jgi:hypothetical protein
MSVISDKVYNLLLKIYPPLPFRRITKEHYVNYNGQRLFFDFYIKECGLLVEVQGQQHVEFNRLFHKDKRDFYNQKIRDNLKVRYIQEHEDLLLIRIYYNEDITKSLILSKINKAYDDKYGFAE